MAAASCLVPMFVASACTELLEVDTPTRVPESVFDSPQLANTMVQSAVADFECAYANYVYATGLAADEIIAAGASTPIGELDRNAITASSSWNIYGCIPEPFGHIGLIIPLATARFVADNAILRLQGFAEADVPAPGRNVLLATAEAYAGYSYTLYGEAFCQAAFDLGPALDRPQVLEKAEDRFADALDHATKANASDIANMARVGLARVRLNLGRAAEAAAVAKQIPVNFVRNATYSATSARRVNSVYDGNFTKLAFSVDPRFRNLQVNGVADPRMVATDMKGPGTDGRTPLWQQNKYTSASSPIVLASWKEAQLIIAEVEGGQSAVDRINALRSRHGLALFQSSDEAQIAQQVREERRRELYLEGHRLNDFLRWKLPFDTGINHRGQPFGKTTCLPMPDTEIDNNPSIEK